MKKVLLLSQVFPPESNAGAKRLGPMAGMLSKHYKLTVVTLKPSHPSPDAYQGFPTEGHDADKPYAIKRAFTFHPHKGSLLMRTLREHAMAVCLAARALPVPADIVLTSPPSMFLCSAGLALARIKGAKFVCDVRDITWGYARDAAGASPAMRFAARMLEKYMLYVLRRADLVVGASHGITRTLVESGVAPERAVTIPNGISTDWLADIVHGTNGGRVEKRRPVVTYAGLIGYNQSLGVVVDAARMLPHVSFVLAGDGPELPMLKKKAAELGLHNVTFRGFLDKEGLLSLYGESDVLFAQARSSPTIDATMVPVKLFEYMATGRPIVYAGRGVAVDLLRRVGCAVTVPPEDPEAVSEAISSLLSDSGRMRSLGQKGRACVSKDFHRDRLMEELADALEERLVEASVK